MSTPPRQQTVTGSADRYGPIPADLKAVILESNLLDRAVQNSPIPEINKYVARIGIIYKEWCDPHYDASCPLCVGRMIKYFRNKRDRQRSADYKLAHQAQLIPAADRTEILILEMIETAQATITNGAMHSLATTWRRHINPNFRPDCDSCLPFVLKEFKAMLPFLQELEARGGAAPA